MLSKKTTGAEPPNAGASIDRGRVRERLQAARAGLEEMRFLREKQRDMVLWALRMNNDGQDSSPHADKSDVDATSEDQRLEATLCALKQKLTHLRRQDLGLKTHLQKLDEHLGELQLSMCRASAEQLDSDSRPSSGFYELSDGGLGSLSNSCTSVYSECLTFSSQASPLSHPLGRCVPVQAESGRRRSADDSSGRLEAQRGMGVRLGSSGIRTASFSSEGARPRPVSTGDLDHVMPPGMSSSKPPELRAVGFGSVLCNPGVDPKYQSSLVSRSGTEVYRYPSPLHAVALQSPIFTLRGDQGTPMASEAQERHTETGLAKEEGRAPKPADYMVKLLQRGSSKVDLQGQGGMPAERGRILKGDPQSHAMTGTKAPGMTCGLLSAAEIQRVRQRDTVSSVSPTGKFPPSQSSQELHPAVPNTDPSLRSHIQHPMAEGERKQPAVVVPLDRGRQRAEAEDWAVHFDQESKDVVKGVSVTLTSLERNRSFSSGHQETRPRDHGGAAQPEFVLGQFVPAGTQMVKVRQAGKKTKAVKLRKRSNEKAQVRKQPHRQSYREQDVERGCSTKTRGEEDTQQCGTAERDRHARHLGETPLRACSQNRLGPGNPSQHFPRPQPAQHPKTSKARASMFPDPDLPPLCQTRKKQSSRKWPSASEIQPHPVHCCSSREMPVHRIPPKPGMMWSTSGRPHSGHWAGLLRPVLPSPFSDVPFGYPATADGGQSRRLPRCESEYSAECASLFHSTVAGSSEGEMSDYTANRFGDSESSCDSRTASDSSLDEDDLSEEEDEGGLVWAEATVGPVTIGIRPQPCPASEPRLHPEPRPEPLACRIKASRALKKKIRRFQPAALKVMTLV